MPFFPLTHKQEQDAKSRITGLDAVKANIQACKAVSRVLRSSLGPKGMDKMMQSPDGDVTISAFCVVRRRKRMGFAPDRFAMICDVTAPPSRTAARLR
jgi:hypothetical protein